VEFSAKFQFSIPDIVDLQANQRKRFVHTVNMENFNQEIFSSEIRWLSVIGMG
jgi:hypothetical protein